MTQEQYEAHQRKVHANRRAEMTPAQVVVFEKDFMAKYGNKPRGPDKPGKKRPKYGNEVVIENGMRMASRKEMKRYRELHLLLKSGEIHFLARQAQFILPGRIQYVCDFLYGTLKCDELGLVSIDAFTVEDVKSKATINNRVFIMKKSLMLSTYNVEIIET